MKPAELKVAVRTKRRSASLFFRKATGNKREASFVRNVKYCCAANAMSSSPESTKKTMISALSQSYNVPPKLMAMTRKTKDSMLRIVPAPSRSRRREKMVRDR